MKLRHFAAGSSSLAILGFVAWRCFVPPGCPVALPGPYRFLDYTAPSSPFFIAEVYQTDPAAGSAASWRFEAIGSADQAAPRLLAHLRSGGAWSAKRGRTGMHVFARSDGDCVIALYPAIDAGGNRIADRHFVRVNGPWRRAGPVERALSGLPSSWLRRFWRP